MSSLANGFVLSTLSILASGYIVYDAPSCRLLLRRATGYSLYFRTIVTGLTIALTLILLSYIISREIPVSDLKLRLEEIPVFDLKLRLEYIPILTLPAAFVLRIIAKIIVILFFGKSNPDRKYKLDLKNLNELSQIVYEKVYREEMIMVTLKNNKVYAGWPVEALNNEDSRWLRLVPQWSGYRDEQANINVETDYSTVLDRSSSKQNQMLISVDKLVTIQPFDPEIYKEFNSDS